MSVRTIHITGVGIKRCIEYSGSILGIDIRQSVTCRIYCEKTVVAAQQGITGTFPLFSPLKTNIVGLCLIIIR